MLSGNIPFEFHDQLLGTPDSREANMGMGGYKLFLFNRLPEPIKLCPSYYHDTYL